MITENPKIKLENRVVGEITGQFLIPSYQRGYRWDSKQVTALLDDIMNNGKDPYCLQPVVVRKMDDGRSELVDGQQRLTTIYILLNFLKKTYKPKLKINFSLTYETRTGSEDFLETMDPVKAEDNIDYHFMYNAYCTIENWFKRLEENGSDDSAASLLVLYLYPKPSPNSDGGNVRFIWYEVNNIDDKDAIALFTRLNIGRIPLTNAELVKALFLRRKDNGKLEERLQEERHQDEVAQQWDTIERELHDEDFWNFITTESSNLYPSRIELIFNLMVPQDKRTNDKYSTFFYFSEHSEDLVQLWKDVMIYYYRIKEWYKKDHLYHKIGYLIASHHCRMNEIVESTAFLRKSEMEAYLDEQIRRSIKFKVPYAELRYDKSYDSICRILLLFNVVSVMNRKDGMRFPFKLYNSSQWSLEHIHPQHPENMRDDKELWTTWVECHKPSLKELPLLDEDAAKQRDALLLDMDRYLKAIKPDGETFKDIARRVMTLLSDKTDDELTHSLSNMALLSKSDNSSLNNALFDVKRRDIIKLDREGSFIPYCTRMVFMKYYTERIDEKQMYVWSNADRIAYIKAMNNTLNPYLAEPIEP